MGCCTSEQLKKKQIQQKTTDSPGTKKSMKEILLEAEKFQEQAKKNLKQFSEEIQQLEKDQNKTKEDLKLAISQKNTKKQNQLIKKCKQFEEKIQKRKDMVTYYEGRIQQCKSTILNYKMIEHTGSRTDIDLQIVQVTKAKAVDGYSNTRMLHQLKKITDGIIKGVNQQEEEQNSQYAQQLIKQMTRELEKEKQESKKKVSGKDKFVRQQDLIDDLITQTLRA